jgi:hypothetical protein
VSGPTTTPFGDVVSSHLEFGQRPSANTDLYANFRMVEGQVQNVYCVDDPYNSPGQTGQVTVADVLLFRANGVTELARRCRFMQPTFAGSWNNYFETTGTNPGQASQDFTMSRDQKPGARVMVCFSEGQKTGPVILGCMPSSNPIAVANRPSKADGSVIDMEFQGLHFNIDNDGAMTVTFNGPRNNDGTLQSQNGPTVINIDMNGNVNVTNNNQQSVVIDRTTQKITATSGPTSVVMDGTNNTVTTQAATLNELASQLNRLAGAQVYIAKSPTSTPAEPLVLGNQLSNFLTQLLQAIQQMTFIGNLGVPTPPPVNAQAFAQLAQQFVSNQKILSGFATTEK